ncbi:putative auxin efflux carrier superfamily [Phaeomoniella chlamydospora]|uniref:Putative auxin efflux carrier superfamily n=1 Tax=Phaeomoniella chlamydospora TaxID=158046 RepID=A0A0G2EZY4_PHACM|nr:putative auxin efflux carrier superfamily [Phaeomoniella chlamydospora]
MVGDDSGSSLLESFLGALQASLAVLLTISYGVIAAQFKLLDHSAGKKISSICVRMFLPALLVTKVGSELHLETWARYVPILRWAATRYFKLPTWVTPAVCFNNTTSLPLLLIEALEATGILERLIPPGESMSDAIKRAESYFLVCAIVGNCLTFAIGPRLIDGEHGPDKKDDQKDQSYENGQNDGQQNGNAEQNGQDSNENQEDANEQTSLLPRPVISSEETVSNGFLTPLKTRFKQLSPRTQGILEFAGDFFNAPLFGAIVGAIIGLVPALHRAFFEDSQHGGVLNAWLTSSLNNIGNLFASLQIIVVGVNLSSSLRKMKRGEEGGSVPWLPLVFVIFIRFILWPILSIAIIYGLVSKTGILSDDPVLWFALMIMPTGPSAMKVLVMADVNGAEEEEMMSISKFLTISYAISPLICFTVVGSLTASEAAMK